MSEEKKDKLVKVDIKLGDRKSEGFPQGVKSMTFAGHVIDKSWQTLEILKSELDSKACKVWMLVAKPGEGSKYKMPPLPKKDLTKLEKKNKERRLDKERQKKARLIAKKEQIAAENKRVAEEKKTKEAERKEANA